MTVVGILDDSLGATFGGATLVVMSLPEAQRLLLGQKLALRQALNSGYARIYGPNRRFLGLVEVGAGGRTVPYRMLAQQSASGQTGHDATQ